mmetsp:Transcript_6836/g.19082  ORF Transcript_6836/g.19082 Transcript_6836/m.19082 type:complete len:96 (+) Transcript_6836:1141-1428(+)
MEHIATATIILQDRIRDRFCGGSGAGIWKVVGGVGVVSMRISVVSVESRCDIMCNGPPILPRLSYCVNSGNNQFECRVLGVATVLQSALRKSGFK